MISPYCKYLDLYPYTWRNLGKVMNHLIPNKKILYILHVQGSVIKAVTSDNHEVSLSFTTYCAQDFSPLKIWEKAPDIEEIHILDKSALIHCYMGMQSICLEEKSTIEYLDFITDYYRHYKGIDIYSRQEASPSFYKKSLDYVQSFLSDDQTLLFVIMKSGVIWFDAVLVFKRGEITEIRTLDTLKDESLYQRPCPDLNEAASKLAEKLGQPVTMIKYEHEMLCTLAEFWKNYTIPNY